MLNMLINMERVSDHCSNIAIYMMQEGYEDLDTHELMEQIKHSGDINCEGQKMYYLNKYKLPETSMNKNAAK